MSTGTLADIVVSARDALRHWDGETAAQELAEKIREHLSPLGAAASELSADAREKLLQVDAALERLALPEFTAEDREKLDMLMLGLWIRIDGAFTPMDG